MRDQHDADLMGLCNRLDETRPCGTIDRLIGKLIAKRRNGAFLKGPSVFKFKLSSEARARLAAEENEALRLYRLANRWLAEELLKLARNMQRVVRAQGWHPTDPVYESKFAWGIIPEVAYRLGATRFGSEERLDFELRKMDNAALRERAGFCLLNLSLRDETYALLTREAANGNPLVYAIDRLSPATADDPIGRRLREIAQYRGTSFSGIWTPEIMLPRERKQVA